MWRSFVILFAMVLLCSCQSAVDRGSIAEQAGQWRAAAAGDVGRYIVVTVRNPPVSLNVRAGSTVRDYGDPGAYGASPRARADVRALSEKYALQFVDAWPIDVLQVHCVVYSAAPEANIEELVGRMRADRRVESVQPLHAFDAQISELNGTRASGTEPYAHLQSSLAQLHVLEAHRVSRGAGVRVAVIDTGIDANHPDLKGRIAAERDLVGGPAPGARASADARWATGAERHGTAVAGVIAALDDNREGIVGIAPAANVLALRACWPAYSGGTRAICNTFTLAQALSAAIELRADVVNLSLSGPSDPLLERLVNAGTARGIVYVGAMPPAASALGFPATIPAVIRVDTTASSSAAADVVRAPGTDILTLTPSSGYDFLSGSSLAAASVSGGIALLKAHQPRLNRASLVDALGRSTSARDDRTASVNFCAALVILDRQVRCGTE